MNRSHRRYADYDPAQDPFAAERAVSAHATAVERWFAPHARSLFRLDRNDAKAIYGWQLRTIESGVQVFGIQCPTGLIVMAAGGHLNESYDLTPAYGAIREGIRQRESLRTIASYVAIDDTVWDALMAPIDAVDVTGKAVVDSALLILLDQHYGRAADAFWQVVCLWHREQFNRDPSVSRAEFDACLTD